MFISKELKRGKWLMLWGDSLVIYSFSEVLAICENTFNFDEYTPQSEILDYFAPIVINATSV